MNLIGAAVAARRDEAIVVGDSLETDVLAAHRVGATGVLITTGVTSEAAAALPGIGSRQPRAQAATAAVSQGTTDSVILLWMGGGVTHIDSFDPKPQAIEEIRGTLTDLPTCLPGVRFCETLPNLARIADESGQPVRIRVYDTLLNVVYGTLALCYTTLVLWAISHWAGSLAIRKFGGWGWVLIAFVAWRLTRKLRPRVARVVKTWATEHMPTGRQRKNALRALGAVAALILLAFVVPWTVRVRGTAVIEPSARVWLHAPETAWIEQVFVQEGEAVQAGQPILQLRSPELDVDRGRARARPRRAADGLRPSRLSRGGPGRGGAAAHVARDRLDPLRGRRGARAGGAGRAEGAQARPRAGHQRGVLVGGDPAGS